VEWTPERIRDAAAEWVWVPDGSRELRTADFHLIACPEWVGHPTQVAWCRSDRPAADLMAEVADQVRAWGRASVSWSLSDSSRPADLESRLREAGAVVVETTDVLAFDMTAGLPVVGDLAGVRSALVTDEATRGAADAVALAVWGFSEPASKSAEFRAVAYLGDEPVATGGCTLAGPVARLWGAATVPAARGRGAYRAVLRERLVAARSRGATLALVKGKVETSAPILRRAGFRAYGQQRLFDLAL
jgi:hypothetical protein